MVVWNQMLFLWSRPNGSGIKLTVSAIFIIQISIFKSKINLLNRWPINLVNWIMSCINALGIFIRLNYNECLWSLWLMLKCLWLFVVLQTQHVLENRSDRYTLKYMWYARLSLIGWHNLFALFFFIFFYQTIHASFSYFMVIRQIDV